MNMNPFTSSDLTAPGGPLNIDTWDAWRTEDGRVSVTDVIADITAKTHRYASNVYRDMVREERVPECDVRPLPPRSHLNASSNSGHTTRRSRGFSRTAQYTPVATAAEMVEIVWQLPGTAEFRRNCARTVVRYLGGDETEVDEIRTNRAAQQHLAATCPDHPARLFGEAVESNHTPSEPVEEQAQRIRKLRLENDKLEAQNLSAIMQALADFGEEIDDAQRWSFRDRMNNLLRGDGETQQQETTHSSQFLLDKGMSPTLAKKVRVIFGKLAAKLKRKIHMPFDAKLPTKIKEVDGHATHVAIYEIPQDLEVLEEAYQELLVSQIYAEAIASRAKSQSQMRRRF